MGKRCQGLILIIAMLLLPACGGPVQENRVAQENVSAQEGQGAQGESEEQEEVGAWNLREEENIHTTVV